MHKTFYRFLLVTLALLINCTLLSGYIEEQMAVPVRTTRSQSKEIPRKIDLGNGKTSTTYELQSLLPAETLRSDMEGQFIATVQEGVGLNTGLRATRENVNFINGYDEDGNVLLQSFDSRVDVIRYAARPFKLDQLVTPISALDKGEPFTDKVLILVEDWENYVPEEPEPDENGFIEYVEPDPPVVWTLNDLETDQPFLNEYAITELGYSNDTVRACISFHDVEQLLDTLSMIAVMALLVLAPFACCIPLCVSNFTRRRLLVCSAAMVVFFGIQLAVYQIVDLPASLLPLESILDMGHYSNLFAQLNEGLAQFASDPPCIALSTRINDSEVRMIVTFLIGIIFMVVLVFALQYLTRCQEKNTQSRKVYNISIE